MHQAQSVAIANCPDLRTFIVGPITSAVLPSFQYVMSYICRDCRHELKSNKPTATCPQCGSIYLIPHDFKPKLPQKGLSITLSERLLSVLFGAVGSLLMFFLWGIAILFKGGYLAARAAEGAFFLGGEKLARLLGVLWNTDKLDDQIYNVVCRIPLWAGYVVLTIVIVGSFGYVFTLV